MKPRISIVTISFNQVAYLKDCIESVLSQNYENLEYIIVDPGSTDGSRELIESYGDKVIKLFQKDSGPSNGLNLGFAKATGDIGYFLNSDDVVLPNSFCTVAAIYEKDPDIDVVMGCGFFIDEGGNKFKRIKTTGFSVNKYIYGAVSFIQQSVFFKMEAFRLVDGFNEANFTCWDGELLLDLAADGNTFHIINTNIGLFRIHSEGITGSGRLTAKYELDELRIFSKITGRDKNRIDKVISVFCKVSRVLSNPSVLFWKYFRYGRV